MASFSILAYFWLVFWRGYCIVNRPLEESLTPIFLWNFKCACFQSATHNHCSGCSADVVSSCDILSTLTVTSSGSFITKFVQRIGPGAAAGKMPFISIWFGMDWCNLELLWTYRLLSGPSWIFMATENWQHLWMLEFKMYNFGIMTQLSLDWLPPCHAQHGKASRENIVCLGLLFLTGMCKDFGKVVLIK